MRESHHATGRDVSNAGPSGMPFRHLDGLELIRQLWEAHPPFTPEDPERLMTALARCWSVEE